MSTTIADNNANVKKRYAHDDKWRVNRADWTGFDAACPNTDASGNVEDGVHSFTAITSAATDHIPRIADEHWYRGGTKT